MADYKELVSMLRYEADGFTIEDIPYVLIADRLNSAADAIEKLLTYETLYRQLTENGQTAARKLIDAYPKWISVDERMPDVNKRVLVCVIVDGEPSVWDAARWNGKEWETEQEVVYEYWTPIDFPVTHWMPMPEPPKMDWGAETGGK